MPFDSVPDTEISTRERLIALRNRIAALDPLNFNMRWWSRELSVVLDQPHICGTCACIGGTLEQMVFGDINNRDEEVIGALIGLDPEQADDLFYPLTYLPWDPYSATPAEAVRVLDHILGTGEVDWKVARC